LFFGVHAAAGFLDCPACGGFAFHAILEGTVPKAPRFLFLNPWLFC
jgi:hypothetical protein